MAKYTAEYPVIGLAIASIHNKASEQRVLAFAELIEMLCELRWGRESGSSFVSTAVVGAES
jgi:hypothetical protein